MTKVTHFITFIFIASILLIGCGEDESPVIVTPIEVVSTTPENNGTMDVSGSISITFDKPVKTVKVIPETGGEGTGELSKFDTVYTWQPIKPLPAGETAFKVEYKDEAGNEFTHVFTVNVLPLEIVGIVSTSPPDGGTIAPNGWLSIIFDKPPKSVFVNDSPAILVGTEAIWEVRGLDKGESEIKIEWEDEEGKKEKVIKLNVVQKVRLLSTSPQSGGQIEADKTLVLTMRFDNPPKRVFVGGEGAQLQGTTATWSSHGSLPVGRVELKIEWEDDEGWKDEVFWISVIKPRDTTPPRIADSRPKDGARDVDPEDLKETVTITFSEAMDTGKTKDIYWEIEGEKLAWRIAEWSDDKTTVTLEYRAGADIGYEAEVTLVINGATDLAGNSADLEITFTTRIKE